MTDMRRDLFVYVSGPMTAKGDALIEENVIAGMRMHLDLLNLGIPNFCPHLGGAFPTAWTAVSWERWLAFDLAVIDRCTHMLMLPRWDTSTGACREKAYAEARAMPVLFTLSDLLKAIDVEERLMP